MLIFIDTEFTSLEHPRLISLGLVGERLGGVEFYGEVDAQVWQRHASEFVQTDVVPLLNLYGEMPHELAGRLRAWAARLPDEGVICCDSDYDWNLLQRLMLDTGGWPDQFARRPHRIDWTPQYGEALELYFQRYGLTRHHALHDARALRFAYQKIGRQGAAGDVQAAGGPG